MNDIVDIPAKDKYRILAKIVRDFIIVNNLKIDLKCQLEMIGDKITIWISEKK